MKNISINELHYSDIGYINGGTIHHCREDNPKIDLNCNSNRNIPITDNHFNFILEAFNSVSEAAKPSNICICHTGNDKRNTDCCKISRTVIKL
jgi:hypothetical protein